MKKHLLIPTITTISLLPLVSVASCNEKEEEELVKIPYSCLDVQKGPESVGDTLKGFLPEYTAEDLKPHNELTISKNITSVHPNSFIYAPPQENDAPLVIKQIDFEEGCQCWTFGGGCFSGCTNLETVIFPPLFKPIYPGLFTHCIKLKTLDLSNITEDLSAFHQDFITDFDSLPKKGKIIVGQDQTNVDPFKDYLLSKLEQKGWTVEKK